MKKKTTETAYCFASGLIEFGTKVPEGALPIARGPSEPLRDFIQVQARHGYQSHEVEGRLTKIPGTECLLVPGIPEAANQSKALDSLHAWQDWIKKSAPRGVTVRA